MRSLQQTFSCRSRKPNRTKFRLPIRPNLFARRLITICSVAMLIACGSGDTVISPGLPSFPRLSISDAPRGGNAHFYWLPPMVANPSPTGTFDATLAPQVSICAWNGGACTQSALALFTTTSGPGSETVRVDVTNQLYIVNWHTDQFSLQINAVYRISVSAGGATVGFADVSVLTNGSAKNVDTGDAIPLIDGKTLAIKFRVEQGMAVGISVAPNPATVSVGKTVGLTATVLDAHGSAVSNQPISWGTADGTIAVVDASGTVTGLKVGSVAITASSNGLTATAQVIVNAAGFTVSSLSVGDGFACGVTSSGAAYCWGGMPGLTSANPVQVGAGITWKQVAVSSGNACGLDTSGVVYCWGSNNGNGGLGDGTNIDHNAPAPIQSSLKFQQVTEHGGTHCALDMSGRAWCWGRNVGATPVPLAGDVTFASIVGGDVNTCGLTPTGAAYCWGEQYYDISQPPFLIPDHVFSSLSSMGIFHVCGLDTAGATWCWGRTDGYGVFGNGTTTNSNLAAVPGGSGYNFVYLSAGALHTCGLTAGGKAYCWGANARGTLGDGTTNDALLPVPVATTLSFASIHVGEAYNWAEGAACALTAEGAVYCWGANGAGQLGDGTFVDRLTPVRVQPPSGQ